MRYHTTCPQCRSVFRIAPEQLDAAEGWAQCGVCAAAFDARVTLTDDSGAPLTQNLPPPETAAPADAPVAPPPSPSPVVGVAQREHTSGLDSIILIDPDADIPDDFGPLPEFVPTPVAAPDPVPPPQVYRTAPAEAPGVPHKPVRNPLGTQSPTASVPEGARAARRASPVFASIASLLLLALLAAQLMFFMRDTLASRFPAARPWLAAACVSLGCRIGLPHDASALQIVGSDLQPAGGGRYDLKLTLGNRAAQAQAWPIVVLTLTGDSDQALARRSFAASEYLADPARLAQGIDPRSETPLTLPLAVGVPVAGYRVEVGY